MVNFRQASWMFCSLTINPLFVYIIFQIISDVENLLFFCKNFSLIFFKEKRLLHNIEMTRGKLISEGWRRYWVVVLCKSGSEMADQSAPHLIATALFCDWVTFLKKKYLKTFQLWHLSCHWSFIGCASIWILIVQRLTEHHWLICFFQESGRIKFHSGLNLNQVYELIRINWRDIT